MLNKFPQNCNTSTNAHRETLSFDANGNIQTALLNGSAVNLPYENLTYTYDGVKKNRLLSIHNSVGNVTSEYEYDAIGNVTKDELEGNENMQWNVYGKLKSLEKIGSGTAISFGYDAAGNRISKKVGTTKWQWYVRDASGNIMATYIKDSNINGGNLSTEMFNMYGSSMLGAWKLSTNMEVPPLTGYGELERGNQEFYFSNQLGNNLVILSDRKEGIQATENPTQVSGYNPHVLSATDYSAFGENLIGREYNPDKIKFGFNGKWNDFETGYQDYGMRMYGKRRFISVDPLTKDFAYYSPYQSTGNSPIRFIDLDGQEPTSPPEYLKNIRIIHDLDKGNVVNGYFDPNDRLHYMSVERIYDQNKKQAFFVHKDNQGNASYWMSQESTFRLHRKSDGTTEANGYWERYETYEQTQQKIRAGAPDVILAFLGGGAAVAAAAPVAMAAGPIVSSLAVSAFTMTAGERGVSAGVDGIVQYSQNIPEHGFGFKNLSNINLGSIIGSAGSGVPLISNAIGNGLETNYNFQNNEFSYQGIGSSKANYSLMGIKTAIGTGFGMGGNALDKAFGKYMNAGELWNKATSDVLSGSVSGVAQKIVDFSQSQKNE